MINFLWFSRKITSWACLLISGLKLIYHWKSHCDNLARSLFSFEVVITESWITEKTEVPSAKRLLLEDKPSAKSLIYIKNNNGTRMEPWGTPVMRKTANLIQPFVFYLSKNILLISYLISHFLVICKTNKFVRHTNF